LDFSQIQNSVEVVMDQIPDMNEILKRLEAVEHKLNIYNIPQVAKVFEDLILNSDSRTLQQIFREVESNDLILSVLGSKAEMLRKIKTTLSKNSWEMLYEDVPYKIKKGVYAGSIDKAKTAIVAVAYQLEEMGEIVIHKIDEPFNREEFNKKMALFWEEFNRKEEGLDTWKKEVFDNLESGIPSKES
jgi:flagellar motor switch protein FliG